MLLINLRTSVRNLFRNKTFSSINILGLAIGIAVFLFIMEYVAFEWTANRFHKNYERIHRINVINETGEASFYLAPGYARIISNRFPQVESAVNIAEGVGSGLVSYAPPGQELVSFREQRILYADSHFLKVFSFDLLAGRNTLVSNDIAITESMARKYFGSASPLGKVLTVSNQFGKTLYTVASVLKDFPSNSDIKADFLLSFQTLESPANRNGNDWADPLGLDGGYANTFLLLKKGVSSAELGRAITQMANESNERSAKDKVLLQPMSEMHLAPSLNDPLPTFGNLLLVLVFGGVAVIILLIAWINYINLSTAQALKRARQVGVRKVLGASRVQLVRQYLTETLLVTFAGIVLAVFLVQLFQPVYNELVGQPFTPGILSNGYFLSGSALLVLGSSFLAGTYVAFVLSSFNPVATIRGKFASSSAGLLLRRGLVVFQFAVSIIFIISTIVLYRQLEFMQNKNLGMQTDQLLVIRGPNLETEGQAKRNLSFKNSLAGLPFIKNIAASNNIPGLGFNFSTDGITAVNPNPGDDKKGYSMFICDEKFFETYSIGIVEGRPFNQEETGKGWSEVKKIMLNETAARQMGFRKDELISGKKIKWGDDFEIVGVVKDYHHLSLQQPIEPTIFLPSTSSGFYSVKIDLTGLSQKLATLKALYQQNFPNNPFEYFFADEQFNKQYTAETRLGNVFIAAACVAIFIACLGLFGLASFAAQQRVKEIGIRKVLGANAASIVALLSRDFLKLVLVAIVIASPIAGWIAVKWQQDFAYPAGISWWIFALAAAIALLIALTTISLQAIKAAISNPIKNLRTD